MTRTPQPLFGSGSSAPSSSRVPRIHPPSLFWSFRPKKSLRRILIVAFGAGVAPGARAQRRRTRRFNRFRIRGGFYTFTLRGALSTEHLDPSEWPVHRTVGTLVIGLDWRSAGSAPGQLAKSNRVRAPFLFFRSRARDSTRTRTRVFRPKENAAAPVIAMDKM